MHSTVNDSFTLICFFALKTIDFIEQIKNIQGNFLKLILRQFTGKISGTFSKTVFK